MTARTGPDTKLRVAHFAAAARRFVPVLLILLSVSGCEKNLFQAPPRGGTADVPPAPVTDSVLTLVAQIPYGTLVQAAQSKIPQSVPVQGDGHIGCVGIPHINPGRLGHHTECKWIGVRVCVEVPDVTAPSIGTTNQCADYHWHADIKTDGPLVVAQAGNGVHVEQPLFVRGQAGVGGDLAKLLSLSGKNFEARLVPGLDLQLDMNDKWCPVLAGTPTGRWVSSASVEVVGKNCLGFDFGNLGHPQVCAGPINLGLADVLNGQINDHRSKIQDAIAKALPCDAIRSKVEAQWHAISIKIDRADSTPVYLNIVPTAASFSGLVGEAQGMKMTVRVAAKTSLAAEPVPTQILSLPPLGKTSADRSQADITLQATAPYGLLLAELSKNLKGRDFQQQTPAGAIDVKVDDVDLYPSAGSVVIGLKVQAKLPGKFLNTTGWVYLSGLPRVEKTGTAISIDELHFATVLDNAFWKAAQSLFETQILADLEAHSKVDLNKQINDASDEILKAVHNTNVPGLKISADTPSIELLDITVGPKNLIASARLKMNFDMALSADLVGQ
ncbi:DUF4403 family protein [Mesorhizobium sp. ArgA1]